MRLSIESENMSLVAADINFQFDVDGRKHQQVEVPDATSSEIFVAVQEVCVRAGDDKVVTSAPAM